MANLNTKEVSDYITNGEEKFVELGNANVKVREGNKISSSHYHITDVPFNVHDINTMLSSDKYYQKYLMVHTPRYIYIAEFKEKFSREIKDKIIEQANYEYNDAIWRDKNSRVSILDVILWNNYINNEILNKYIEFYCVDKYEQ